MTAGHLYSFRKKAATCITTDQVNKPFQTGSFWTGTAVLVSNEQVTLRSSLHVMIQGNILNLLNFSKFHTWFWTNFLTYNIRSFVSHCQRQQGNLHSSVEQTLKELQCITACMLCYGWIMRAYCFSCIPPSCLVLLLSDASDLSSLRVSILHLQCLTREWLTYLILFIIMSSNDTDNFSLSTDSSLLLSQLFMSLLSLLSSVETPQSRVITLPVCVYKELPGLLISSPHTLLPGKDFAQ